MVTSGGEMSGHMSGLDWGYFRIYLINVFKFTLFRKFIGKFRRRVSFLLHHDERYHPTETFRKRLFLRMWKPEVSTRGAGLPGLFFFEVGSVAPGGIDGQARVQSR
ncbi:hypothetical protein [Nguyenibacter sp. L1]|uniref:hypothetical protein n=1 Tax=Nguyenibacter sp. L1 TaxID=3049350 RepID=UPI002B499AE8|nr:hypothetical protein [Nguyenibacter sp. L1]WRH89329.1 hypothetical protein QN315_06930 [Nguyenibacter sp. L1]